MERQDPDVVGAAAPTRGHPRRSGRGLRAADVHDRAHAQLRARADRRGVRSGSASVRVLAARRSRGRQRRGERWRLPGASDQRSGQADRHRLPRSEQPRGGSRRHRVRGRAVRQQGFEAPQGWPGDGRGAVPAGRARVVGRAALRDRRRARTGGSRGRGATTAERHRRRIAPLGRVRSTGRRTRARVARPGRPARSWPTRPTGTCGRRARRGRRTACRPGDPWPRDRGARSPAAPRSGGG